MDFVTTYLPITALVAIVMFLCKETLEFFRKRRERKRKISAIKILLSEEIEKNHWALKQMFSAMQTLKDIPEFYPRSEVRLLVTRNGVEHFRVKKEPGDDYESGHPIPKFTFSMYEKLLPSLAELDSCLFEVIKCAYEELIELAHYRDILVSYLSGEEVHERELTRDFLADFSTKKADYYKDINIGYTALTGKELKTWKLR